MTTLPPPLTAEPTRRRRPVILTGVALAVVAVALTAYLLGRGGGSDTAEGSSPSAVAATGLPAAVQIECANVDRARLAWVQGQTLHTTEDAAAARKIDVEMAMDDTTAYLRAVEGYADQPAKALVSAIAQYNVELSLLNAELTITGKGSEGAAMSVAVAARKVHDAYSAWQNETCV